MQDGPGFSDAAARWREEVFRDDLYEISGIRQSFQFKWDALVTPESSLIRFDAVGLNYARDEARIRKDGRDGVRVQITYTGGFSGLFADRDAVVGPGTAVLVDQTLPFFNRSADTRGLTLALPRSAFEGGDTRSLHGRVVSGAAFTRLKDWLVLQSRTLGSAPATALPRVTFAMAAVVRGTFEAEGEPELQASGALDDLALVRLRELAVSRRTSLTVEEVARAVGVSRSQLYRVAAPFGGVMEVIWTARVEAAHAAILKRRGTVNLAAMAAEFAFADGSHFQRRFRTRFGFNPSDLRPLRA